MTTMRGVSDFTRDKLSTETTWRHAIISAMHHGYYWGQKWRLIVLTDILAIQLLKWVGLNYSRFRNQTNSEPVYCLLWIEVRFFQSFNLCVLFYCYFRPLTCSLWTQMVWWAYNLMKCDSCYDLVTAYVIVRYLYSVYSVQNWCDCRGIIVAKKHIIYTNDCELHHGRIAIYSTKVWRHKKHFLEFPDFIDENWPNDGWDMNCWIYKYCHTFSIICTRAEQNVKLQNVYGDMSSFNCSYLSKRLLDFCQIFTIISVFESSFWIYYRNFKKISKNV